MKKTTHSFLGKSIGYLGLLGLLLLPTRHWAQGYAYQIDLENCKKDRIAVALSCPKVERDTAHFNFPMTVPGTYDILNYGTYIVDFKAYDATGKALKVTKTGANTFNIYPGKALSRISYWVNDSWDSKEKEHKIFEPAGTGFEKDEYFFINNGGLFGFLEGQLMQPFTLAFKKPADLVGYSSLQGGGNAGATQTFQARDYHQLIDNPILFTGQASATMKVANADITIASYYANNPASAALIQKKLDESLHAIEQFVGGELPIENYAFLNYLVDLQEVGEVLSNGNMGLFQLLKIKRQMGRQGFGALEHGNSSSYYLPDFGHDSYVGMVTGTAIHEFMHIYAPLSLHSDRIGNFDYVHPKMSRHLWLYEGVTEYFAVQIAMQGKLETVENTLQHDLRDKIVDGYSYPDSIPFTVMSENVFDKPYKQYYTQVYERGAIMGMLLDFEIMRLSKGEKTLKSVVFELVAQYGKNKSFSEDEIIPQFVKLVHPDLQQFFDRYVTGKQPLAITEGFSLVGINYQKEKSGIVPIDLLSKEDNGVEANLNIVINNKVTIKKATENNLGGFMAGDKVDRDEVISCFKTPEGENVPEGTLIHLTVLRKGAETKLEFPAKFKNGTVKNTIAISKTKTEEQERYFRLWTTGEM